MTTFKPGDHVDITIKGVPVHLQDEYGCVWIVADAHDGGPGHWQMPPQAAVTRVAPAQWPPRLGDVWRSVDKGATPLFAATNTQGLEDIDDGKVYLVNVAGTFMDPDTVLSHGPLTLVHREDEQEDGAS